MRRAYAVAAVASAVIVLYEDVQVLPNVLVFWAAMAVMAGSVFGFLEAKR